MFLFGASGFMTDLVFSSSTPLEVYKIIFLYFIIVFSKFVFLMFSFVYSMW